jgi:hypothetical protein
VVFCALLTLGWGIEDALDRIRFMRPVAVAPYADQAAVWYASSRGKSPIEIADARRRVERWHRDHPIDSWRVISSIHARLAS